MCRVHVTHLALYNLILNGRGGRRGYFRWNEDICGFIRTNWSTLMPHRKKTQSWHSTVAGTLSVHCPSVFQSGKEVVIVEALGISCASLCCAGTMLFGEHGWWSLTSLVPPNLKAALGTSLGKRSSAPSHSQDWDPPPKKAKTSAEQGIGKPSKHKSPVSKDSTPVPPPTHVPLPLEAAEVTPPSLLPMTVQQEQVLEKYLSQCPLAVRGDPKASRLLCKLKVRSKQRLYNQPLFDLDSAICRYLSSTVKYVVDKKAEYNEQITPVLRPPGSAHHVTSLQRELTVVSRLGVETTPHTDVLDQLSLIPVLSRPLPPVFQTFRQTLCGAGSNPAPITSPYTTRKLPPFIFRTSELLPAKVRLNRAIVERGQVDPPAPVQPTSIDFCYLQEHHLPAVNSFVSHFFWPVDLSECLQYPDFTCVVLYGKLVIACGFMTPDVKVNEAYISFLLVHPDFQRCSIGKIVLYHLIQSCMGKDVTLHVSVDNPAMLMYQAMGFKSERYCLDFYRHYYPEAHHLSKNAYFMRLRK